MKRLNGMDAMLLYSETPNLHTHTLKVAIINAAEFDGAPVSEIYSIGVLSAGSAFNMTVWSYVDQVDISILSDDRTFGDIHEATDAMIHGLAEIRRATGLSAELATVDTAMAPAKAAD